MRKTNDHEYDVQVSGEYKNPIDYLLTRVQLRTSITSTRAKPGAICGSYCKLTKIDLAAKV